MAPAFITMTVILLVALGTVVLVAIGGRRVGRGGLGRGRAPKMTAAASKAVRHLNGDGQPPRVLTRI